MVQMLDLKKQFEEIREDVIKAVTEVLESGRYVLGQKVSEFEESASGFLGSGYGVGVASGTDALHLALKALGIGPGDEVITSPFTFFATAEAILYLGATPVFADIEPDTYNIDPARIKEKVTSRTKALLPVHLFGHPADMAEISGIAARHGLSVIEDCAQSFGSSVDGKMTGSIGDAGCFSFYPSKNLGAFGDGGLVTVSEESLDRSLRILRNHGSAGGYVHSDVGFNSRLDEMQAAILLVKMKHIRQHNDLRRSKAEIYSSILKDSVACPVERAGCHHVYHQYTIASPRRDEIRQRLQENDIPSMVYYPVPVHLQPALSSLGYKEGDMPVSERAAREVLSLPMGPEIADHEIESIAKTLCGA